VTLVCGSGQKLSNIGVCFRVEEIGVLEAEKKAFADEAHRLASALASTRAAGERGEGAGGAGDRRAVSGGTGSVGDAGGAGRGGVGRGSGEERSEDAGMSEIMDLLVESQQLMQKLRPDVSRALSSALEASLAPPSGNVLLGGEGEGGGVGARGGLEDTLALPVKEQQPPPKPALTDAGGSASAEEAMRVSRQSWRSQHATTVELPDALDPQAAALAGRILVEALRETVLDDEVRASLYPTLLQPTPHPTSAAPHPSTP